MGISQRICLYGNSIILGTLRASLRLSSQFEIITVMPSPTDCSEMEALKPDVIVFDLEAPHPDAAFSLLGTHSRLLLIGISPDTNLVKMWAGQQLRELSTQGLLEIIREQLKKLPVSSGKSENNRTLKTGITLRAKFQD